VDRHCGRPHLRLQLPTAAIAEVYASQDAQDWFVSDFVAAWTTVMELDRFVLA